MIGGIDIVIVGGIDVVIVVVIRLRSCKSKSRCSVHKWVVAVQREYEHTCIQPSPLSELWMGASESEGIADPQRICMT